MTDYARRVKRYLRDEYGVVPAEVRHGRHPALAFRYGGVDQIVTINRPGNTGINLLPLKLQDIRRQLGVPPSKTEGRPKMKLEDMLPRETAETLAAKLVPIPPAARPTHPPPTVRVAGYDGRLRVLMPFADAERLFCGAGVRIVENNDGSWELHRSITGNPFLKVHAHGERNFALRRPLPKFGISPCEAVEVDGALLLRSDPATRNTLGKPVAPQRARQKKEVHKLEAGTLRVGDTVTGHPEGDKVIVAVATASDLLPTSRERMLACLREIKNIEAAGTHRLVRMTSGRCRWAPAAEVVELED